MSGTTKLMTAGGGGVNLTPASSIASDVTVNVPSQNCTLGIQGPAFSAYLNPLQNITSTTWTKASINTEEFDTASCFDSATNYRFTPNVSGYYQINGNINGQATSMTQIIASIYKNGSEYKRGGQISTPAVSNSSAASVCSVIYFNGTTDYVELYGLIIGTSPAFNSSQSYFSGALVRAA